MVDEEEVTEALTNVIDPELGLDFVELGLVYGVEIDGATVNITFTLTTPACPIGPQVSEQMKEFVGELDGVEEVVPNMIFAPPWTPEKMCEDAKFALGYWPATSAAAASRRRTEPRPLVPWRVCAASTSSASARSSSSPTDSRSAIAS